MTAYRPPRRLALPALLILLALALTSAGCASIASPRGWASPLIANDLLIVAHRDRLLALDPASFDAKWAFPQKETDDDIDVVALYGTPATLGQAIFVPTHEGTLYALDAATGSQLWPPFQAGSPLIGGVVVSQDSIYFGSDHGRVYALDAATGQPLWPPFTTGEQIWSTPSLAGDTLYVTSLDGHLYALDATTGQELWSFDTGAAIASPPVVDEASGVIFVAGFDSRLRAIDADTHEELWSATADNWFWTRPLVVDGVVYAGSLDGNVYAIDAATGDPHWAAPFSTGEPIHSAPVASGDLLVIVTRAGAVYAISLDTGTAAQPAPRQLQGDVLADPLVVTTADTESGEEVLVVTTGGDLVRIDPQTLLIIGQPRPLGD